MFTLILIIIVVLTLAEYYRSMILLRRRIENIKRTEGFVIDEEGSLSNLRKKFAAAYFVLVLFHSILYTSLKLS